MNTADKIREIEKKHHFQSDWFEEALQEMAEWKDEQEIEFLQSLMFQSATYHIFDKINERIKLLKGVDYGTNKKRETRSKSIRANQQSN